jgi:LysM repeat protein
MTLAKAVFERLDANFHPIGWVDVQFNPTELTFNKAAQYAEVPIPGLDMPVLQFVRGQTETLNVDLFFDTTDDGTIDDAIAVTERTDRFYQLIKIDRATHAPPICRFAWGDTGFPGSRMTEPWSSQGATRHNGFQCVVESVRQRFTMFSTNGRPVRATLTVALKEFKTLDQQIAELNLQSPDHTHAHVVQRGDTLARIAATRLGDPAHWRAIAEHNGLDDPLDLRPGTILEVPPVR